MKKLLIAAALMLAACGGHPSVPVTSPGNGVPCADNDAQPKCHPGGVPN